MTKFSAYVLEFGIPTDRDSTLTLLVESQDRRVCESAIALSESRRTNRSIPVIFWIEESPRSLF